MSILLSDVTFRIFVAAIVALVAAGTLTGLTVTMALSSPLARFQPDPTTTSDPFATSTTTPTPTTTPTTTTATPTTAANTTAATTTPAPLPLAITCPMDITVELGASLEPLETGSPTTTGGCGTPTSPVLSYSDSVQSMTRRHSSKRAPAQEPKVIRDETIHEARFLYGGRYDTRSVSFSTSNAQTTGTFTLDDDVSNTLAPDPSVAVGIAHVVHAYADAVNGTLVFVSPDKTNLASGRVSFVLRDLATAPECGGNATQGQPQVVWDHDAQVWLLSELGQVGANTLCLYVSSGSDPLASNWTNYAYQFPSGEPQHASLAVWGAFAYVITIEAGPNSDTLCVLDRQGVLASGNATLFCAPPFDGTTQTWTPVHAPAELPPVATATASYAGANAVGAVFMRPIDDELLLGATTPSNDQIGIEHWYNINITAGTYQRIRYVVQVPDFRSNTGTVATPTVYNLSPIVSRILSRLTFRWLPLRNQQSVVGAFTVAADTSTIKAYWFELRWASPSLFTLPLWTYHQAGAIDDAWMPSASMDSRGTLAVAYTRAGGAVYPSVRFATRLGNDPLNEMRDSISLHVGQVGSALGSDEWGRNNMVAPDPNEGKVFFVAAPRSSASAAWQETLTRVRIQTEVIARNWTANTFCPGESVSCTQLITAE